jgi:hypothetical protein
MEPKPMTGTRLLFFAAASMYKDRMMPRLPGVARDAARLRETLTKFRDGPTHVFKWLMDGNARKQDILDALMFLAATAKSEDQVVLYFGLHGWRESDETGRHWKYYLMPWDANPDNVETQGISTDELGSVLQRIEASEVLLILDCCHAGGLPDIRWLRDVQEEYRSGWRNLQVFAAARGPEDAVDGNAGGLFIPTLCEALAGRGVAAVNGRIYAQIAGCYAAVIANQEAARLNQAQAAVLAGYAEPMALTCVNDGDVRSIPRNVSVYSRSQDNDFLEEVKLLIQKSRRIRLVGTGLNVLWHPSVVDLLFERAQKRDADITICLGNPFSRSVQDRLIEEEMMNRMAPLGAEGIERLFETYLTRIERLGSAPSINVRLFESHPTFATLIFDRNVFHYPYGYRTLGTDSPVTGMIDDGRDDVRFYVANAELIIKEAVPAAEVSRAMHDSEYVGENWVAAAIYVVPEATHPLYTFGSKLLGYDLHAGCALNGRCPVGGFRRFVGEAAEYGFHATIGDALYFGTDAAFERMKAELRFLTRQFPVFDLTDLQLVHPFHENPEIIALRCQDTSGVAESLHFEVVSRIYPRAISTTYRSGRTTKAVPETARNRLMIDRLGAPFILGAFEPHFTLGSSYRAEEDADGAILERLRHAVRGPSGQRIRVRDLRLLVKPPGATRWLLDPETFRLKVRSAPPDVRSFREPPRTSRSLRPPREGA